MICSSFESSGSSFVFIVLFGFLVDRCWRVVEQMRAALGQEWRCSEERRQYFLKGVVFDQNRLSGLNKDLCVVPSRYRHAQ